MSTSTQALRRLRRSSVACRSGRRSARRSGASTFVGPWVIGLLLFTAGPMIASLVLSFTDFNMVRPEAVKLRRRRQLRPHAGQRPV